METPLVSVIVVTYNHEKYIEQALNGILSQKTDFMVEILIGDDASTDDTSKIVAEFCCKNSKKFIPILRKCNIGPANNMADLILKSRGRFIAICDGDDYWVDTCKLQKQVEFLKENSECTVCCHSVIFLDEATNMRSVYNPLEQAGKHARKKKCLTIHDLLRLNTVPSVSVMYRWSFPREMPFWMRKYDVCDYPLLILHANKGSVGVISDVMGVYRIHAGSVWYGHGLNFRKMIAMLRLLVDLNRELSFKYKYVIFLSRIYGGFKNKIKQLCGRCDI